MTENKSFEKGAIIFTEKSVESSMYIVVSGKVGIYANYGKANETLLTELEPGKYFGELAVIDGMPRSATAVAAEETVVTEIKSEDFEAFVRENPEKVIPIFQNLCNRLRELSNEYVDACAAVAEYVEAEKAEKPMSKRLLEKIKKLIILSNEYKMYEQTAMIQSRFGYYDFYWI